ncbi:MAG: NAD-dependent epimerase/dehydratase family protein [Deltaproteobacteria bacterium]|nr:NAD-dependent epimerase/dehydratase family protein [Deltaproteobacteria bacterium]
MRAENKLEVGIIGIGRMGVEHLKVIAGLGNARIKGIADPRANADEIGEVIGKEARIFLSAQELFQNTHPEAVHVVTPPGTHYEYGKMALENGAHVFIEKPFVLEGNQAEELVRIAKSRGLKLIAGHQLLAQHVTRKAEEYVKNIGEIVHAESYFSFRKVRKSISAVEQAIDILPHPVYTLLHFLRIGNEKEEGFLIKALDMEADGEVRAIIECGKRKGILLVSLKGRPVDSYLKIVGTNGTILIDYVRGVTINLSGSGADTLAAVITPYRQAWQAAWKTTKALTKMALKKDRGYEGLRELIDNFYQSILDEKEPIIKPESIIETVAICEKIGLALKEKESETEVRAREKLETEVTSLPPVAMKASVLVTGGAGFLGRAICRELRSAGWPVKAVSRTIPPFSGRLPGVEYAVVDLADKIPPEALEGVAAVIHCAAETAGGKEDHERNSIEATQRVLEAAATAGVKRFIHISSLAVLKPGRNSGKPLDETSPVDKDNPGRGAYVWGKAQADGIVKNLSPQLGIDSKIIRPGPLVDFENFEAPGRLGREVGSYFIVMGSKRSPISLCGVHTAAKVVRYCMTNYESVPKILNLIEARALTRQDLIKMLLENRKGLKPLFIPGFLVRAISGVLYLFQKVINPKQKPLSIAKAFSSETYKTDLAAEIISKAIMNQSI